MPPPHRQRGLADTGRSGHHRDGRPGSELVRRQQGVQHRGLAIATHEPPDVHRQPGRHDGGPARLHGARPAEDLPATLRQVRGRLGVLGKRQPQPVVGLQRLGALPTPVQRHHQLPDQPLPPRIRRHQLGQLRHQLHVPAELELHLEVLLDHTDPQLLELRPKGLRPVVLDPGQQRPPPPRQRTLELLGGTLATTGGPVRTRPREPLAKLVHVRPADRTVEPIPGAGGGDRLLAQNVAQHRDPLVQLCASRRGRLGSHAAAPSSLIDTKSPSFIAKAASNTIWMAPPA